MPTYRRRPRLAPVMCALSVTVVLALLGAGLAGATGTALVRESTSSSHPRAKAPSYTGTGTLTLDDGDIAATRAVRGDYAVLQAWEAGRIPALRRANPDVVVLMYKDASAVRKDSHDTGLYSTGMSYEQARQGDWLLRDQSGTVIEWSDWRGLYPTDVGSRGYQEAWLSNVMSEIRSGGWDGVMIDDTLTSLSHPTVGNRVPVAISTDAEMYAAMESFLARVGPGLSQAGMLGFPNVTVEWNTWRDVMEDWTPHVSGWENEFFVKWGQDRSGVRFTGADWQWKSDMAAWCARRGVPLLAVTYSNVSDRVAQSYHRATWLLTWNGRTGASIFTPDEANTDHWRSLATTYLGKPRTPRTVLHSGVNRRVYSRGLVLVNPTASRRRVALGKTWRTLAGKRVRSVLLAPRTGLMLRRST